MSENVHGSVAGAASDAAAVRGLEDRLAAEYLRLVELTEAKDHFLTAVSHELRTPLTSILSSTELLAVLGGLDGAPAELVGIVDRNVVRMLRLIDGLALLAKLEAGQLTLDKRLVDLPDLVGAAVDRHRADPDRANPDRADSDQFDLDRPGADRSDLDQSDVDDLDIQVDLRVGPPVNADPERLGQILDHLLDNAAKYTPAGGRLTVRATPGQAGWTVAVEDTGIGIPAAEQPTILDGLTRGSNARQAGIPGAGLGLAISRRLAQLHGGELDLTSAEGAGTTATLRLPFAYAPRRSAAHQP